MRQNDHWMFWPALASTAALAGTDVLRQWPGLLSFILIPLSLVYEPAVAIIIFAVAAVLAMARYPRRALSALFAVAMPFLLYGPISRAADYVHLALTVGLGIAQIGPAQVADDDSFAVYDWSVGFAGGPITVVIYDASDRIRNASPVQEHLPVQDLFWEECTGRVTHLVAHYYGCTF